MRRAAWLLLAVLLLAAAAWLMSTSDAPEEERSRPPRVGFPTALRTEEYHRMQKRRTLPAPPRAEPPLPLEDLRPSRPQDPLLAALAAPAGGTAVVLEANALTQSPVGQLLIDCMRHDERDLFDKLKTKSGVDLLKDLDRVAFTGDTVMLSGHFAQAHWDDIFQGARRTQRGDATIYLAPEGDPDQMVLATWKGQLLIAGEDAQQVEQAIDRLEGRAPLSGGALTENDTYGEVYGVVGIALLEKVLGASDPTLARLKSAADRIELHVDAMSDVAMVAKVRGKDARDVEDLAKSLGAALALGRMQAQAKGDKDLVELLDYARVVPDGSQFTMELALPMAFFDKHLAACREPTAEAAGP